MNVYVLEFVSNQNGRTEKLIELKKEIEKKNEIQRKNNKTWAYISPDHILFKALYGISDDENHEDIGVKLLYLEDIRKIERGDTLFTIVNVRIDETKVRCANRKHDFDKTLKHHSHSWRTDNRKFVTVYGT